MEAEKAALAERLSEFESYMRSVPVELGREPSAFASFREGFEQRLSMPVTAPL